MEQVTEKFVKEQVAQGRCPDVYHCIYRVIKADPKRRNELCTSCWNRFCAENEIHVVKEIR